MTQHPEMVFHLTFCGVACWEPPVGMARHEWETFRLCELLSGAPLRAGRREQGAVWAELCYDRHEGTVLVVVRSGTAVAMQSLCTLDEWLLGVMPRCRRAAPQLQRCPRGCAA